MLWARTTPEFSQAPDAHPLIDQHSVPGSRSMRKPSATGTGRRYALEGDARPGDVLALAGGALVYDTNAGPAARRRPRLVRGQTPLGKEGQTPLRYRAGVPRSPLARTTVRDALDSALVALTAAGVESPRFDAEVLLAAAMGVDRGQLIADPSLELEPDAARTFMGYAARRRDREPVAYILGRKGFRAIELDVDARVLIPRPETEFLVEAALDLPPGARVCDVGTGSGAVALALKQERPDLAIAGTDASPEALDVARANAARLGLEVTWVEGDLLAGITDVDAVLSNPPYVEDEARLAPDVAAHEPALALRAGPDGLDVLRRLAPAVGATSATLAAFEVGAGQAADVAALLQAAGFADTAITRDLAGIERIVAGRR